MGETSPLLAQAPITPLHTRFGNVKCGVDCRIEMSLSPQHRAHAYGSTCCSREHVEQIQRYCNDNVINVIL